MRKVLGGLLIGLGIGAVIGLNADKGLLGWAVVVAAVGAALLLVRRGGGTDLIGDATVAPKAERPSVAGLGTRVEQILGLAEEQAADQRRQAEADAERIVADARAEADRIRRTT